MKPLRNQVSVADVLDNSWLHRKIDRFLKLWQLLRQKIKSGLRTTYEAEARGILRNIFGISPSRRCSLETVAHYFRDLLWIANGLRMEPGGKKWHEYAGHFVVPVAVIL